MEEATIERLKKNPFYKMSKKQKDEAVKSEHPMVEFGVPRIHNTTLEKHPTLGRKKRT